MVSVESKVAEFADMVKLPHGGDIIEFIKWQIGSMLGMDVGPRPTFAQSAPPPPSYVATTQPPVAVASQPSTPTLMLQTPATTYQQTSSGSSETFTDSRDGQTYKTVVIGGKRWMAQNLNYRIKDKSWCYGGDNSYCDKYGRWYDWNTAKTVCPSGYHLPSRQEWDDLVETAGGSGVASKKLKARSGWSSGWGNGKGGNGTDNFGFSALPGGGATSLGGTAGSPIGERGCWWTATESYYIWMWCNDNAVREEQLRGGFRFSVRCVAD